MSDFNEDPIYDIRAAVANVLRAFDVQGDHKRLTDSVVDELPHFFRQELRAATLDEQSHVLSVEEVDTLIRGDVVRFPCGVEVTMSSSIANHVRDDLQGVENDVGQQTWDVMANGGVQRIVAETWTAGNGLQFIDDGKCVAWFMSWDWFKKIEPKPEPETDDES